jgi:DNA-binding NarL/FixJ family response regulator
VIYKNIRVAVLSGLGKEETEENCSKYNVHRYFLKPFNPVDLVNAVQHLIENKMFDTYYPMKAV